MANKKYILTPSDVAFEGQPLFRIQALIDFGSVKAGDFGGLVQSEYNLSHTGNCWITYYAKAVQESRVSGNAWLMDIAQLRDQAVLCDNAILSERARALKNAKICDDIHINGHTAIGGYVVVKGYATISSAEELIKYIRGRS